MVRRLVAGLAMLLIALCLPSAAPAQGTSDRVTTLPKLDLGLDILYGTAQNQNKASGPVAGTKRVALVVGNGKYQHESQLPNPANDARGVTASLKGIGFDVDTVLDADLKAMNTALARFARKADGADLALVYYSGHGIEVDGRNYLIPVDAQLRDAADVEFETLPLDLAVSAADRAGKVKLIVLDACRNNPFRARMVMRQGKRSVGRGLAATNPATGMLIAYAAKGGTEADDGAPGGTSPFTTAFLKYAVEPRLDVRIMLGRVRDEVVRATGRQEPFIYGSLGGDEVFLNPRSPGGAASIPSTAPAAQSSQPQPPMSEAAQTWRVIESSEDIAVLEAFRKQYGAGNPVYDQLAASRIAALRKAQEAKAQPKIAAAPPVAPPAPSKGPAPQPAVVKPAIPAATDWPKKPVTLIVPFAPGGSTDVIGRTIATSIDKVLGQPVLVENVAGASGGVGASRAAKAAPDGHTLFLGTVGTHAINQAVNSKLGYDPSGDFQPVMLVSQTPMVVIASGKSPYASLQNLIADAKANPGKLTFGSTGVGGLSHLACAKAFAQVDLVHVPYRGSGAVLNDLVAGMINVTCEPLPTALSLIQSGGLRGLAVLSPLRSGVLPNVPTARELGFDDLEASAWTALFAPRAVPAAVVAKLHAAVGQALASSELKASFQRIGAIPPPAEQTTPEHLKLLVGSESARWGSVAKAAGIKID